LDRHIENPHEWIRFGGDLRRDKKIGIEQNAATTKKAVAAYRSDFFEPMANARLFWQRMMPAS
jgi:hypothetical protein